MPKKWSKDLSLPDDYNWREIFKNLKFITKDTSLFWFQYRIAHRILGVNKYLYFSKITDSQTCALCKLEPELCCSYFLNVPRLNKSGWIWNIGLKRNLAKWLYLVQALSYLEL